MHGLHTHSPRSSQALSETPTLSEARFHTRSTEFVIPGLLGLLLWSVICWESLVIEVGADDTRLPHMLLLLQPLLVLAVGLVMRSTPFALIAFPMTLLIAVFGLEPLDISALSTFPGALTLSGSLILFLFGASRYGPSKAHRALLSGERLRSGLDASHRRIAFGTWTRAALLLALLLVPLHALYGEAGRLRLFETFGDAQPDAAALIHTVHLFVAVLASAMFFLSPHINLTLDVHDLHTIIQSAGEPKRAQRAWRTIFILLAFAGVTVSLFLSLRAP